MAGTGKLVMVMDYQGFLFLRQNRRPGRFMGGAAFRVDECEIFV
jgi:hypothetical protein